MNDKPKFTDTQRSISHLLTVAGSVQVEMFFYRNGSATLTKHSKHGDVAEIHMLESESVGDDKVWKVIHQSTYNKLTLKHVGMNYAEALEAFLTTAPYGWLGDRG